MPPLFWVGIGLALLMLLIGSVVAVRGEKSLVDQRLEQYLDEVRQDAKEDGSKRAKDGVLTTWITKRVEPTGFGENIARELARADIKLKIGEYIALIIIASGLAGLLAYSFGGGSLLFGLIGVILGSTLPRFFVRYQQQQRLRRFDEQLPDMLNLMVNGLRTGFSALQAMEAVSQEMPSPISDEFRRVVQEMQLGVPMEGALENLQRRITSNDLDLAITAINIQREVGGNLAEILDTISYTIRERVRMQGEIRATVAQVAFSGRFLAVLPIFISLLLWAVNRDYMLQFFEEPIICGASMLIASAIMLVLGYLALTKLADVEI
ncbi:MAG: type II secretion system F family protein [Anaerolineales bacterium]|nr:type II secretion system F family protein [Anaerolineales bacterium]